MWARGDLNSHAKKAQPPQDCASANSATRPINKSKIISQKSKRTIYYLLCSLFIFAMSFCILIFDI